MAATLLIGSPITESAQDITTEHLLFTYTSSGETCVAVQITFSNLTNTAASIRVRLEHTLANDTVLTYQRDVCTVTKWTATNTVAGMRMLGPVLLLDGEKLKVYAFSNNPGDTSIAYAAKVLNAAYATSANLTSVNGTAGIKVDLVDAPNTTAVTAFVTAVWAALLTGITTADSIGKRLKDFITTMVYSAPLTAQQTRDALALAPTEGTPEPDDGIDGQLNSFGTAFVTTAADVVRIRAAVYDSFTATTDGDVDTITLSNDATVETSSTGRTVTEA